MSGKVVSNNGTRAAIYSAAAAISAVGVAIGVFSKDDIDAGVIADAVAGLIAVGTLVLARLNVWLSKPQLPPPPH